MLGSANFDAGPLMAFASGNLCYQIEHHLFPDLPSNRYAAIATRVRALCERFGLPYTTGSLLHQYLQTLRTIHVLALPDRPARTDHDEMKPPAHQEVPSAVSPIDASAGAVRSAGRRRRRGFRSQSRLYDAGVAVAAAS
jgi:hypothetical protein